MSRIDSRSSAVNSSYAASASAPCASPSCESDTAASSGPVDSFAAAPGIWMPSQDTQGAIYKDFAEKAFKDGTAKSHKRAPCGADDLAACPTWDITPKFTMGSHRQLYVVDGEIWVRQNTMNRENSKTWFDIGRAPMFMPRDPSSQT